MRAELMVGLRNIQQALEENPGAYAVIQIHGAEDSLEECDTILELEDINEFFS